MPLIKSGSKKAVSGNIREMMKAGHPQKQAVAAALRMARKYGKKYADGGTISDEDVPPPAGLMDYGAPSKAPSLPEDATVYPEWTMGNTAPAGAPPQVGPVTHDIAPPPEEKRGVMSRAWSGAKEGFGDQDIGFSKENRKYIPATYQGIAAGLDVGMRSIPAALKGAAGAFPGVMENLGMSRQTADRAQRDLTMLADYPGSASGVAHSFVPGKMAAAKQLAKDFNPIQENAVGALGGKLKQPAHGVPYDMDPAEVKAFKKIGGNAGTQPGGLYAAPDGTEWYMKQPDIENAKNEKLAAELYKLAGVPTAEVKFTEHNGKPSIASKIIKGSQIGDLLGPNMETNPPKNLKEGFPADAWLANWDVIGAGKENPMGNIIVDSRDNAYRIDQGGALRFGGLGSPKPAHLFGDKVIETKSMRDPNINGTAAMFFREQHPGEVATAQRIADISDGEIYKLVERYGPKGPVAKVELADKIIARKNDIAEQYGVKAGGGEPPAGGGDKDWLPHDWADDGKQVAFNPDPKAEAEFMIEHQGLNPPELAATLYAKAKQYGHEYVDKIVSHLPHEITPDIDMHLNEIVARSGGEDPWKVRSKVDDPFEQKPFTEEDYNKNIPDHEALKHLSDEEEYWKSLDEQAQKDKDLVQGVNHDHDVQLIESFIQEFKPIEWQHYRPKVEKFAKVELPPEQEVKAKGLGFNTHFFPLKGGRTGKNYYPEKLPDPRKEKAIEKAWFSGDEEDVASFYGDITPYMARAEKAFEVDWPKATGFNYWDEHQMHNLIEAAHREGADVVVIHGIRDVAKSGTRPQTQYAFLNTNVLRAPHAELNPERLHLAKPLAGLVGGGLFVYGTIQGQGSAEAKEPEVQKKAAGGAVAGMTHPIRMKKGGMLNSPIPGRTDKIPVSVPSGSYVLPADIPSALGQGNTMAGGEILKKMFSSGPYGLTPMKGGKPPKPPSFNWMKTPRPMTTRRADGGEVEDGEEEHVPIIAAGGEYILHPEVVRELGNGDIGAGHKILDKFVLDTRKKHIATLKKLKPPKK